MNKRFNCSLLPAMLIAACMLTTGRAQAQTTGTDSVILKRLDVLEQQASTHKPSEEHFMVAGVATFGFVSRKATAGGISTKTNSIVDGDNFEFSPMFLWRHGNKFLLEFEPSFAGDGVGVNWADISYFAAPGLIIRAGYLVLPFGTYSKKLAAGWINKLATDPEGVADLPPLSDYGVEVEGGFQAGTMKWSYDLAISNGMQLNQDGTIQNANLSATNNNKNFTGRLALLPFSNSSLEIGLSGMTGKLGDPGSPFENAKAKMYAFDLNLVENIRPFQLNIKGQYNVIDITQKDYINPSDNSNYQFTNHTTTGYIMAAVRPAFADNNFLKQIELAARFGNYRTPAESLIGTKDNSFAIGLNYWLNWRSVIHFTYEGIKSNSTISTNLGGTPGVITQNNAMYLQFSILL
jgi:hypothetical protein